MYEQQTKITLNKNLTKKWIIAHSRNMKIDSSMFYKV